MTSAAAPTTAYREAGCGNFAYAEPSPRPAAGRRRGDDLVVRERGRHDPGKEVRRIDRPLAARPDDVMWAPSATSTVGRSDAGSACAMLPPIVPRFRTARIADLGRRLRERGRRSATSGDAASSACVVSAPMRAIRPDGDAPQLGDRGRCR